MSTPAGELIVDSPILRAERSFQELADQAPTMVWLSGADQECIWVNRRWLEFTGRDLDAELGYGWTDLVHRDDLGRVLDTYATVFDQREPFAVDCRLLRWDGEFRWLLSEGRPFYDGDGRFAGFIGSCTDITDRKQAELGLARDEKRFHVALDCSTVGFAILQSVRNAVGHALDFEWAYANPAALRVIQRSLHGIVGQRVSESLPEIWETPNLFADFARVVETGAPADIEVLGTLNGAPIWFRTIVAKLDDGIAVWFADETESKRTQQSLREADRRKDEFLATLAHELRNPLAPIQQVAMLLRAPGASEAQLQWGCGVIERQVRHMALLLDDLLDTSRIGRGQLVLRKEPVDVCSVIRAAVESARPLIDARQHLLTLELPPGLRMMADPLRLSQVISNLLTNAAKYSEPRGRIRLLAAQEGHEVVIQVSDLGIGIRSEDLPRVFELFAQLDCSIDRTQSGLGIGLALTRGLVELHGGTIVAQSDGVGCGSTFTVRLPCEFADHERLPEPLRGAGDFARHRVLVVDDNRDAADSLAMLLKVWGHEVHTAHDGFTALDIAARVEPELVLLDLGMAGLSGFEVAERIRRQRWGRSATLVAVTGWGHEEVVRRAILAGFDRHVNKPIDAATLRALAGGGSPDDA